MHDDEAGVETVGQRPVVRLLARDQRRDVRPVWDDAQPIRPRALLLEPATHRVADRHHSIGTAQIRADEQTEEADEPRAREPVERNCDLGKDILADDDERRLMTAREQERNVADDGWVGAAEHDVRPRLRQAEARCLQEIREIIERPAGQLRAIVRRRLDAEDLDAPAPLTCRQVRHVAQPAGEDRDLELAGKLLEKLREQVRRRLHSGPVVLIEDEDTRLVRHGPHATVSSGADPLCSARLLPRPRVRRPDLDGA
jgi:hypothetical protein